MRSVIVTDYRGREKVVPLDEALTPTENFCGETVTESYAHSHRIRELEEIIGRLSATLVESGVLTLEAAMGVVGVSLVDRDFIRG